MRGGGQHAPAPRVGSTGAGHSSVPAPACAAPNPAARRWPLPQLPWWTVEVAFGGRVVGSGGSFDKRGAEQAAAREALEGLGQLPL